MNNVHIRIHSIIHTQYSFICPRGTYSGEEVHVMTHVLRVTYQINSSHFRVQMCQSSTITKLIRPLPSSLVRILFCFFFYPLRGSNIFSRRGFFSGKSSPSLAPSFSLSRSNRQKNRGDTANRSAAKRGK